MPGMRVLGGGLAFPVSSTLCRIFPGFYNPMPEEWLEDECMHG